jgi:5-bromo-4-chloroindolyl phosphate hydrolysis protein
MKLSENTTVTMSLVIVIIGGVFWLSRIYYLADSASAMAKDLTIEQRQYHHDVTELKTDVKWIKQKLGGE